jgi:circadian clock protein KaiB
VEATPEIETTVPGIIPVKSQFSEKLGYVLRLFVAGHNANTERILQTLHQMLEQSLRYPYTLKVVDVFKHPDQAELYQVSATPTLVRAWPQPVRRLVGDIDNTAKILQLLVSPEA